MQNLREILVSQATCDSKTVSSVADEPVVVDPALPHSQEPEEPAETELGQEIREVQVVPVQDVINSDSTSALETLPTSTISALATPCDTCKIYKEKIHSLQKSHWKLKRQLQSKKDQVKNFRSEIKQLNKVIQMMAD